MCAVVISVTELVTTQTNFYPSTYGRHESLKKQIDRSGVLYTLKSREKNHDKGRLLMMKMQKEFWRLTVALLYFGVKKCLAVRQAILIDITTICGTTMHS